MSAALSIPDTEYGAPTPSRQHRHHNHTYENSLSEHHHSEGKTLDHSTGTNPRNIIRGRDTRALPAYEITQGDWLKASQTAMQAHVGDDRSGAKKLADILECSPRTAENYLQGRTAPSGLHFLRALASIPEFQAEVRRLSAMQADMDPEFDRAAMALLQVYQRRQST